MRNAYAEWRQYDDQHCYETEDGPRRRAVRRLLVATRWLRYVGGRLYPAGWPPPAALACVLRGHDLHDDGYAGPESGCVDVNCHRCGWSAGRTWLY